ncbi:MAG: hypothetical protein ACLFRL_00940 [Desulfohalobiaceae bacterium]
MQIKKVGHSMFCTKCKFTSFDQLERCPACGSSWQQIKKDLNLDWLSGAYPVQSEESYVQPDQGLQGQDSEQADVRQDQSRTDTVAAAGLEAAQEDLELDFAWEEFSSPAQPAQYQGPGSAKQSLDQKEEIAFPELEGMLDTGQDLGQPAQEDGLEAGQSSSQEEQPAWAEEAPEGPGQDGWGGPAASGEDEQLQGEDLEGLDFELEPEGQEVDITALFDELESDLDSRRKS